jgi:hypothetical protein
MREGLCAPAGSKPPLENLEQLAIASRASREAKAIRDTLIIRARQDGATLRTLAEVTGLTPQGVKLICDKHA